MHASEYELHVQLPVLAVTVNVVSKLWMVCSELFKIFLWSDSSVLYGEMKVARGMDIDHSTVDRLIAVFQLVLGIVSGGRFQDTGGRYHWRELDRLGSRRLHDHYLKVVMTSVQPPRFMIEVALS